jgi:hypothetical protein
LTRSLFLLVVAVARLLAIGVVHVLIAVAVLLSCFSVTGDVARYALEGLGERLRYRPRRLVQVYPVDMRVHYWSSP